MYIVYLQLPTFWHTAIPPPLLSLIPSHATFLYIYNMTKWKLAWAKEIEPETQCWFCFIERTNCNKKYIYLNFIW